MKPILWGGVLIVASLTACGEITSQEAEVAPEPAAVDDTDIAEFIEIETVELTQADLSCPAPTAQQFCDPVPVDPEQISATARDRATHSLRPDLTCLERQCEVRMKGMFAGKTLLSEPLPFKGGLYEGDDWLPVPLAIDRLSWAGVDYDYGWQVGYDEQAVEVRVKMLRDYGGPSDQFLVAQSAGFEHVQNAYWIISAYKSFYDPDSGSYNTYLRFGPNMGPQPRLVLTEKGLNLIEMVFDPEADDFVEQVTEYFWVYGGDSEALMTRAEAMDALGATSEEELDRWLNE